MTVEALRIDGDDLGCDLLPDVSGRGTPADRIGPDTRVAELKETLG